MSSKQMMHKWSYSDPQPLTFPAHGSSVVTCLLFSHNRIITASDDHQIHVYSPTTGELLLRLEGHEGGVWSIVVAPNSPEVLVSGSTDRTMRVWDLTTGKCTHVFGGYTSTVRRVEIVKPVWVDIDGRKEKWPKSSLIVAGSRDHTLRVWKLPKKSAQGGETLDFREDVSSNPYHLRLLAGHTGPVRDIAAHGRTAVSGSYDATLKVWDIITGECIWTLQGHTQKVYAVALDHERNQVISGSMDDTVRIWSLKTGQATHILNGHTSLVALLSISPSYLVSASADATLLVYEPSSGALKHKFVAHTGAVTCFQADEFKVVSGSGGDLILWDIYEGKIIRKMLKRENGTTGIWQVAFEGRWCVAASKHGEQTYLNVWDFGGGEEEAVEDDKIEANEEDGSEDEGE